MSGQEGAPTSGGEVAWLEGRREGGREGGREGTIYMYVEISWGHNYTKL